jgi:hypothetical protein
VLHIGERLPQFSDRLTQAIARLLVPAVAPQQCHYFIAGMRPPRRQSKIGEQCPRLAGPDINRPAWGNPHSKPAKKL